MPTPSKLPGKQTLKHLLDEGMTHQQIADWVYEQTGERVSRPAVSMALRKYDLLPEPNRHWDELPWEVREEHLHHYDARMLRALGRKRAGRISKSDEKRLASWLAAIPEGYVIHYEPESVAGFWRVPRREGIDLDVIREPDDGSLTSRCTESNAGM